jgi:hypothetical protein
MSAEPFSVGYHVAFAIALALTCGAAVLAREAQAPTPQASSAHDDNQPTPKPHMPGVLQLTVKVAGEEGAKSTLEGIEVLLDDGVPMRINSAGIATLKVGAGAVHTVTIMFRVASSCTVTLEKGHLAAGKATVLITPAAAKCGLQK